MVLMMRELLTVKVSVTTHTRITVMDRPFLSIPSVSPTSELVFTFAGLTFSDLYKSLFEGTLEVIMWSKWGSSSTPCGRGDLHITHPDLCE